MCSVSYTVSMIRAFSRNLLQNFLAVFKGRNFFWHALAITLTAALILSGADWWFFEHTRSDAFFFVIMIAGIGGFFAPVVIPVGVYLWGEFSRNKHLMDLGAAAGQAAFLGYLVSIIYKSLTGRVEPEFLTVYSMVDTSRVFNFGFLEYGIFWGWPSSHTAVAFAGAFAFVLLSRTLSIRTLAMLYAFFIAVGAAISFHWLSDVVAGAIIGSLIGTIVAKSAKDISGAVRG